jgi:hypothetical protein
LVAHELAAFRLQVAVDDAAVVGKSHGFADRHKARQQVAKGKAAIISSPRTRRMA